MGVEGASVQVKENGEVVYRASALGGCTKMLVAERMGYDLIEPRGERALAVVATMNSGHTAEDRIVEMMAKDELHVTDRDGLVILPLTGKIQVVGHVDGFVPGAFVEIKSLGQKEWDAFWKVEGGDFTHGRWPQNLWQMSAYGAATGQPCQLVVFNRDTEEMKYVLPPPFYDKAAILKRVLEVERAARLYSLPELCDTPSFPCPVFYLHTSDRMEFDDDEQDRIVQELAEAYQHAKGEKDKAEQTFKGTQKALLKAVEQTGKWETLEGWKVTAFDPGKGALDREKVEAFVEAHGGDMESLKQRAVRVTPPTKRGE